MLFPFRAWSDCLCENHPIHHILPCPWVVASRALGFTGERMGQQRAIGALCAEILRLALQASGSGPSTCSSLIQSPFIPLIPLRSKFPIPYGPLLWIAIAHTNTSALAPLQNLQRLSSCLAKSQLPVHG